MTQASSLITAVSTKTLYFMLFVCLDNWRTGDKLVPTSAGVEGLRRAPRNPLDSLVLTAATFPCSPQEKVLLFFFSLPSFFFSFLPLSLLITEANGCSELRGGFIAQLHGGGTWFSLSSAGYQF